MDRTNNFLNSKMFFKYISALSIFYLIIYPLQAQDMHMMHEMSLSDKKESMPDMENMPHMHADMDMHGMYGLYPMNRDASGTSWVPDSSPIEGIHIMHNGWTIMLHGFANGIYDNQGGKRGDEKGLSTSMFALMGYRNIGPGIWGLIGMLSLDPTMGRDGYPLLLQTGETGNGKTPLIDRQHPHDLFMELATTYSIPISDNSSLYTYFGLPGEPALGPPVFMHRFSGMDIPEAPISHHWLDSTHITYGVATLGFILDKIKIEGSVFKGREPDQDRWNIESPKFDSYSGRLSFNPVNNWALQASCGHIHSPEQLEPDVNVNRYTLSAIYNKPFSAGNWQTTFAWGLNDNKPGHELGAFLLESTINIKERHTFFSRFERVQKDELFLEGDPLAGKVFTVNKLTGIYTIF